MNIGIGFSSVVKYLFLLIILYIAGSIILRYFRFPTKLIITLISNSLIGLGFLILANVLLAAGGMNLPVNPFNVIFSAIFGLPGAICLVALKFLL
ncbi:MAG: pro-sigmaK processing inhibitor BofA family protein [Eubacteriaceae bacterium]|nr:pro-sigmaK processing inhibitor BofA family protein [Eubacteriaceae bacterium]